MPRVDVASGAGTPARALGLRRAHMGVEPLRERAGCAQRVDDPALGLGRVQPRLDRPVDPRGEVLVAQQVGSRVVRVVPARYALQAVARRDADAAGLHRGHRRDERLAAAIVGDGRPEACQLVGGHDVASGTDPQAGRGELHVARPADGRPDRGLVGRLVGAEPDVAVRPEDAALAELAGEVVEQGLHRSEHELVVLGAMLGEVRLGVVGLEALVERHGAREPAGEHAHLRLLSGGSERLGEAIAWSAPGGIRTPDLRYRKPALYPLSYGGAQQ